MERRGPRAEWFMGTLLVDGYCDMDAGSSKSAARLADFVSSVSQGQVVDMNFASDVGPTVEI
jgi:hypothetical protein